MIYIFEVVEFDPIKPSLPCQSYEYVPVPPETVPVQVTVSPVTAAEGLAEQEFMILSALEAAGKEKRIAENTRAIAHVNNAYFLILFIPFINVY